MSSNCKLPYQRKIQKKIEKLSTVKPVTNVENKTQTRPDTTLHMSKQFKQALIETWNRTCIEVLPPHREWLDLHEFWKDRYYETLSRVPLHRIRLLLYWASWNHFNIGQKYSLASTCSDYTSFSLVHNLYDDMLWLSMHRPQKPITEWSLVWIQSVLPLANGLFQMQCAIFGTLAYNSKT